MLLIQLSAQPFRLKNEVIQNLYHIRDTPTLRDGILQSTDSKFNPFDGAKHMAS